MKDIDGDDAAGEMFPRDEAIAIVLRQKFKMFDNDAVCEIIKLSLLHVALSC